MKQQLVFYIEFFLSFNNPNSFTLLRQTYIELKTLLSTVPGGICVHFLSRAFLGWIVSGDV